MAKVVITLEDDEENPGTFEASFEFDPEPDLSDTGSLTAAQTKALEITSDHFMTPEQVEQSGGIPIEEESQIILPNQGIIKPH